ncbi:hypothetical protein Taro_038107 [Colocasia esculenta]|uniref:Uncharacterized protein n=1 Tax=Colocasia esculenta TaxID=4460 RepID=A0A843WCZ0_COLES|nr:hypothetical protein [Colocasia esculenta]
MSGFVSCISAPWVPTENSELVWREDYWSLHVSSRITKHMYYVPYRYNTCICQSFSLSSGVNVFPVLKSTALALKRSCNSLDGGPLLYQLVPSVGVISFALWGLGPLVRLCRQLFFNRNDNNWKKSRTHYIFASYLRPLLLWSGATLFCRALDPIVLPTEASQAVKQRLLNFIRSLSTVLAFSFCLSSFIQQAQRYFMEKNDPNDTRNMGFQFAGKAVYTAVWVAAVSLFMELLGFSTQKWLTAGGLGTVLLTLAGREIFTNFLSSVMIHATRPFILNEWIQTRIEGYDVSGTVEHVGWWSPTIIRGEDREAVHIPNHKFTVSIVRNLSQKTHWRIKTHLAISHLDVNKINNIVADMRKVLAKNPQVEQRKLHRRVFLDNIDPENQALLILISCFVKTSHFEEYLCVKEAILLDLLRVISHHRARLATPIRTVQKFYRDSDVENIPFAETIFSPAGAANNQPLILIEPSPRINGEDKAKARPAPRNNEEQAVKAATSDTKGAISSSEGPPHANSEKQQEKKVNSGGAHADSKALPQESPEEKQQQKKDVPGDTRAKSSKIDPASHPSNPSTKEMVDSLDPVAPSSKETSSGSENPPVGLAESKSEQADGANAAALPSKPDSERPQVPPAPAARPTMEENLVLGVALDGAKRTLPIEEGMGTTPSPVDPKGLASLRSASGSPPSTSSKEKKDGQIPAPGAGTAIDQRDQER